ncbi:MAG: acylphosphatase [Cytophagales bacterium]|nr:acylphosphatase [Cytophagales bacterium]
MITRYTINIKGKVQGVYFRASTLEVAQKLDLHGIVKNEPDGSVSIEVEGTKAQMGDFLKWCHKGPLGAEVREVKITQSSSLKNFQDFRII